MGGGTPIGKAPGPLIGRDDDLEYITAFADRAARPHRRSEEMRCDERLGQLPGGAEGGDRVGVTPARHFEAPASVVEMHPDGRFDVRS
jgi:hypothetical protein